MVVLAPSPEDLDELAQERLDDAQALLDAGRYSGAHYMCGYAIEMKLKSHICKTHGWQEYPPQKLTDPLSRALKTHKLAELLLFASAERTIGQGEWSVVLAWNPDQRYRLSAATAAEAAAMIAAVTVLMNVL
jgi:HEPN domain-containing protein